MFNGGCGFFIYYCCYGVRTFGPLMVLVPLPNKSLQVQSWEKDLHYISLIYLEGKKKSRYAAKFPVGLVHYYYWL